MPAAPSAPAGHVCLVLSSKPFFYLQIPLNIIDPLCLRPCKYLVILGWCVLGVEGVLAKSLKGAGVDLDGKLDDKGVYYYLTNGHICRDLSHAVDLEVIKQRSNVPSETTSIRDDFRNDLLERDQCCIWTGAELHGEGVHIIPFKRGSEWLQKIIENRPRYEEPLGTLTDINDIRNGMFAASFIHSAFDLRDVVILKTPNHILETTDIPPRAARPWDIKLDVTYPRNERFTLQWLRAPDSFESHITPDNIDATFKRKTRKVKPSNLLLHYNYGAAAIQHWGKGTEQFQSRPNIPRPAEPIPAPVGPTKTIPDRSVTIGKLANACLNVAGRSGAAGGGMVESGEGKAKWDEDDVMLFLWGNSPAATEYHYKKQEEKSQKMENWKKEVEVPSDSV